MSPIRGLVVTFSLLIPFSMLSAPEYTPEKVRALLDSINRPFGKVSLVLSVVTGTIVFDKIAESIFNSVCPRNPHGSTEISKLTHKNIVYDVSSTERNNSDF